MRTLLFTLISLACAAALAGPTVYKWVDENGVVHFSDQPHANAQKVQVDPPQTYQSGQYPAAAPPPASGDAPAGPAYQSCAIARPLEQETYNNVDSLGIAVSTDPMLRPGDQIYISVDGAALNGGAPTGQNFTLTPVDRGTHTVSASVRDPSGATVCQTATVTFNVHQASVRNPVNPVRPR
ncbi:MAG TPA: DUF4124 domain-containing protein [Steroidobacteraceae bacterium]|nr:DUF4124 domain-containing protein [Steroidobacteraceae bacterium]